MLLRCIVSALVFTVLVEGSSNRSQSDGKVNFNFTGRVVGKYATYREIAIWYYQLHMENPRLVRLIDIGNSSEGRKQFVMRVSSRRNNDRPAIFIDAALHAREWLAPATLNYVIHNIIQQYNLGVGSFRRAVQRYIFYFLSVANPDGYAFSFHRGRRYWRKNRRNDSSSGCLGVDLNRNWNISFGGLGSSTYPCEENYQGSSPFSEPETRNMRDFMLQSIGPGNLTLYISLHSFGQFWVVPWSHINAKPPNFEEMKRAALYASEAAHNETGVSYDVSHGAAWSGVTVGGSDDWTLENMRANYSYTVECRPRLVDVNDNWWQGFRPPPSIIPLSGREVLASLMALVDTMNRGR